MKTTQSLSLVRNTSPLRVPSTPSPVVQGSYTLQTSAPAVNFDPDNPALHFVCEVQYSALGHLRLVDPSGQVLASAVYANDSADPSRAASTALPQLPDGYEIVPGQSVFGFNETRYQHRDPPDRSNADSRAIYDSASGTNPARDSNRRGSEPFRSSSHHA